MVSLCLHASPCIPARDGRSDGIGGGGHTVRGDTVSLTDVARRNAKPESKPKKLADAAGFYLYIAPTGTKTWRVDYRHAGRRQTTTLG